MPADYLITLADTAQLPDLIKDGFLMGHHESRIAFVGRSNVGKSSLINALVQQQVARVSATPGKTRAIHFFLWKEYKKIVVDLPGYGFAKISKDEQKSWSHLLNAYFKADTKVDVVFVLIDSRHGPTDQDIEALEYFADKKIPIQIILTKMDQLKTQSERAKRKKEVLQGLAPFDVEEKELFWVSVKDQRSIQNLRNCFK